MLADRKRNRKHASLDKLLLEQRSAKLLTNLLVALNRTNNANLKLNWAAVVVLKLATNLLLCCLPETEEMDTSCCCNAQNLRQTKQVSQVAN